MPIPLALLASIPAVFQGAAGVIQRRKAARLNPIRPTYTIPNAVNENVAAARQAAYSSMPGYGSALNNLQAGTANAFRAAQMAGNGSSALAVLAAAQGNEANGMNALASQNAQYNAQQRANLQGQLGVLAGEQRFMWDYNQRQKFEEESSAKAALVESANRNVAGSLSGLSSIALTAMKPKPKPTIPGLDFAKFMQGQKVGQRAYNDASLYQNQYDNYS
jgi:hypothetical protein